VLDFVRQNKADWQEVCQALTGDVNAVAYVWDDILAMLERVRAHSLPNITLAKARHKMHPSHVKCVLFLRSSPLDRAVKFRE
jgi:hypothetical protein